MREEMENKLDAILMENKKSTSMTTNPRSEINEMELCNHRDPVVKGL